MLRNWLGWWPFASALALLMFPLCAQCADLVIGEGNTAISDISEQIVIRVYEKIGLKVEIVHVPLERQLSMANVGSFDGTGARQSGLEKAYPNLVMVPTPLIASEPMMVFTKDKTFEVKGWESVRPYKIGTIFGFKATGYAPEGLDVETASTIEQAFQKLDAGRTDVVIAAHTTGLAGLHKTGLKSIRMLQPPITTLSLYAYLNKKNSELLPKLDQAIKSLTASGEIQGIIEAGRKKLN